MEIHVGSLILLWVAPIDNIEGLEFLKQNGFVETIQWTRMLFGKDLNWSPQKMYSRMGGGILDKKQKHYLYECKKD